MRVESPRQRWEQWQREGRPTFGSHKPLLDYLVDHAHWHVATALIGEAKGHPFNPEDLAEVEAVVEDLRGLLRERSTR